jgi:hypothetical protein
MRGLGPATVIIDEDSLKALIGAAESYATDLESGLEDGTYDDRADLDEVQAAIEVANAVLQEVA